MSHLIRVLSLIISLLASAAGEALAADSEIDCARHKSVDVRIQACSVIIASSSSADVRAAAHRNRAVAYSQKVDPGQAVADFTAALALKPDDTAAYSGRGQSRLAGGDVDGAIADLTSAIQYPKPSARLLAARGYAYLVKGDATSAIADFSAALKLEPGNAAALNSRGLAHRKAGDLRKAIDDYTAAIQLNPIYALAYNNRGYAYEAQGDKSAAAADFRRALLLDPALVGAKEGLKRLGEPIESTAQTERLISEGKILAQKNCAWCHAIGDESESPNARAPRWREISKQYPVLALRDPLTRGIARPHDQMPKFELSEADIDKIVAYINSLSP